MRRIIILLSMITLANCRERYDIPMSSPQTNYLVVEGAINPQGITTIHLSRTTPISEGSPAPETGASVQIEGENNAVFGLVNQQDGRYISDSIVLDPLVKYRLHINIAGKEYFSTYSSSIQTPAVDSISWKRTDNGLDLFVNAHDVNNKVQYYRWDYDEVWEFHSSYRTEAKYVPVYKDGYIDSVKIDFYDRGRYNDSIYKCWQSYKSGNISLASTAGLSGAVLYKTIKTYPDDAIQFSQLYSIDLRLHGLSKDAYEFYQKMKKNSESLGSIFDAQPSDISGNITCVNNPTEKVIGFVEISTTTHLRKFISREEIQDWRYNPGCGASQQYKNIPDTVEAAYNNGQYPTLLLLFQGQIVAFMAADKRCVDCTLSGTNIKPDFWP